MCPSALAPLGARQGPWEPTNQGSFEPTKAPESQPTKAPGLGANFAEKEDQI